MVHSSLVNCLGLLAVASAVAQGYGGQVRIEKLKCLFFFACWRFMFAFWQIYGYFNILSNKSQKKRKKSTFFNIGLSSWMK